MKLTKQELQNIKQKIKTEEEWELFEHLTHISLRKSQIKIWKQLSNFETDETDQTFVLMCHRGFGKTFIEAGHRLIKMIKTPRHESFTMYPKMTQAQYSLNYTKSFIMSSRYLGWLKKDSESWQMTKLVLGNGSMDYILSPSQRTAAGSHVNVGYVGEGGRMKLTDDDIFYSVCSPMTRVKKGLLFLSGTPFNDSGFFIDEFNKKHGKRNLSMKIPFFESEVFTKVEQQQIEEDYKDRVATFRREYLCETVSETESFIPTFLVNKQIKEFPVLSKEDLILGVGRVDILGIDPSIERTGMVGLQYVDNVYRVIFELELPLDMFTSLVSLVKRIHNQNPLMKIYMDSTGNLTALRDWLLSKGLLVIGKDLKSNTKEANYTKLLQNLRSGRLELSEQSPILLKQLKSVPYQFSGNHIQFKDQKYDCLNALLVCDLNVTTKKFAMVSF